MSTNVCQSMNVKGVAVKATYQSNVWMGGKSDHIFYSTTKFWPSKCIKFGWGSRILAQLGSGSGSRVTYCILIILEKKLKLVSVEKTPTVQTSFF